MKYYINVDLAKDFLKTFKGLTTRTTTKSSKRPLHFVTRGQKVYKEHTLLRYINLSSFKSAFSISVDFKGILKFTKSS